MGTGAFEQFAGKAKDISNACLAHVLEFLDDGKVLKITVGDITPDEAVGDITPDEAVGDITPDEENQLLQKKIGLRSRALGRKGLYAFIDQDDKICYIGQGGEGASTTLTDRTIQELRLWKKTPKGNNGGTFSKNLQAVDGIQFDTKYAFWKHIAGWKMRILHADGFSTSTELIEAVLIHLFNPRLNKRARVAEATLEDVSK